MGGEVGVGGREMSTTDETTVGTEGTGVRGGEDKMTTAVDVLPLALGITAPKHKDQVLTPFVECGNSSIGEFLPAFVLMAACAVRLDGEGGIEQQGSLFRPTGEVARCGDRLAEVTVEFLVDIIQRRRDRHVLRYRETEPLRLPDFVVRVLPDNDHTDTIERAYIKGTEDLCGRGKTLPRAVRLTHKLREQLEIRFVELGLQNLTPTFFDTDVHNQSTISMASP